jgi:hypothetical protein
VAISRNCSRLRGPPLGRLPRLGVFPSEASQGTTISWGEHKDREIVGFFEAFVFEPEDVAASLVAVGGSIISKNLLRAKLSRYFFVPPPGLPALR